MIREVIWHECRILCFSLGRFKIDGGAVFGIVPKIMWSRVYPSDSENYIELELNSLLIQYKKLNILLDTGIGNKSDRKLLNILGTDSFECQLEARLKDMNISFRDITHVVPTHLHFDHCGGNTECSGEMIIPRFPTAAYVIQKKEWEDAMVPDERTRGSYFPDNYAHIPEKNLILIDGNETLAEGRVMIQRTGGHSTGHQLIRIKGKGTSDFIFPGDVIPLSANINLPWVSAADLYPRDTLKFKRDFLKEVIGSKHILALTHESGPERICRVYKDSKGKYAAEPDN